MIKRKPLSLLLAFALALSLLPVTARAEEADYGTDFVYDPTTKTLTITGNVFYPDDYDKRAEVETVVIHGEANNTFASIPVFAGMFREYTSLTAFSFVPAADAAAEDVYSVLDGVLFNAEGTLLICYPAKKAGSAYVLPAGVTNVSNHAFEGVAEDLTVYARSDTTLSSRAISYLPSGASPTAYATNVSSLTLSAETLTLNTTDTPTATLTAAVKPGNATVTAVIWESSDEDVAAVEDGVVTAVNPGNAVITATTLGVTDGDERLSKTCAVTVEKPVSDLTIPSGTPGADGETIEVNLTEGADPVTLTVELDEQATDLNVGWTSADAAVALLRTVSGDNDSAAAGITAAAGAGGHRSSAVIVPQSVGATTITASAGGIGKTFSINVTKWVKDVSLSETELTLRKGEEYTLTAEPVPSDAANQAIVWASSDEDVAAVEDGVVTAKAGGSAKITASITDHGVTRSADCDVTVVVETGGLALDKDGLTLSIRGSEFGSAQLTATVEPEDATDPTTWSSSDETVATVDRTGKVTAVAKGTTTVTAASGAYSVTCDVTVVQLVESITLRPDDGITLTRLETATLRADVFPLDADDRGVEWTAAKDEEGDDVVTLTDLGYDVMTVTAVKAGTTTITVTAKDGGGTLATCDVTVEPILSTAFEADAEEYHLKMADTDKDITVTVTPANADKNLDNSALIWTITGEDVVALDVTGDGNGVYKARITPKKVGSAYVTVTLKDDDAQTATYTVTVDATAVDTITLTADSTDFDLNYERNRTRDPDSSNERTFTASIDPLTATNRNILWSSSDESIATVSAEKTAVAEGEESTSVTVTALKPGTVTITAAAEGTDGKAADSITFTVPEPVTGVSLNLTEAELDPDDGLILTATVAPANAADKTLIWSSDDEEVATVDQNGHVTIVSDGSETYCVTITAATLDGGYTDECNLTVRPSVTAIVLAEAELTLHLPDDAEATVTAAVEPVGANPDVYCVSSDRTVVTVQKLSDSEFLVRAVANGDAVLTFMDEYGKVTETCAVKVRTPVTGVSIIDAETGEFLPDEATTFYLVPELKPDSPTYAEVMAWVSPRTASNTAVSWNIDEVNERGVVRVTDKGGYLEVVPVKAGREVLTVTTEDGGETASHTFEVKKVEIDLTHLPSKLALYRDFKLFELPDTDMEPILDISVTSSTVEYEYDAENRHLAFIPADDGYCTATVSLNEDYADRYLVLYPDGGTSDDGDSHTIQLVSFIQPVDHVDVTPPKPGTDHLTAMVNTGTNSSGTYYTIYVTGYMETRPADNEWDDGILKLVLKSEFDGAPDGMVSVAYGTDGQYGTFYVEGESDYGMISVSYPVSATTVGDYARWNDLAQGNIKSIIYLPPSTETAYYSPGILEYSLAAATESALSTIMAEFASEYGEDPERVSAEISLKVEQTSNIDSYEITPQYTITGVDADETGSLSELDEPIVITLTLQYKPRLLMHIHKDGDGNIVSVDYPEFDAVQISERPLRWTVTWSQQTFSTVRVFSEEDFRSGQIGFRIAEDNYSIRSYDESKLGTPLPTRSKDGYTFNGWMIEGVGTVNTLTDAVLTAIDASESPVIATPSFTRDRDPEVSETSVRRTSSGGGASIVPAKPAATVFADVAENHWAAKSIAYVVDRGIFGGVGNGSFAPELAMSRAMIAQVLYNFDGGDKTAAASPFADVAGKWYEQATVWAAQNGVAGGSYGRFDGDAILTREQLATMLYRYAVLKGYDTAVSGEVDLGGAGVSDWAADAMRWAVGRGLIGGTDRGLEPQSGATRAQVAAIMMRFCEAVTV